jgi:hypothetical protein
VQDQEDLEGDLYGELTFPYLWYGGT